MRNTIYASFSDPSLSEKAAGALLDFGARQEDLSIIMSAPDPEEPAEESIGEVPRQIYITPNMGGVATGISPFGVAPMLAIEDDFDGVPVGHRTEAQELEDAAKHGISTTTSRDAEMGALKGSAWGAGIGALAVLTSIFVPGVGLVVGAGMLATAIGAFAATVGSGAVAGAITGYLKDQGVEPNLAEEYERTITTGGAILAITLPSGIVNEDLAWRILDKYAGHNVTNFAQNPYMG